MPTTRPPVRSIRPRRNRGWFRDDIGDRPYDLEWPGGQDTPGSRSLPAGTTDVAGESHVVYGAGDVGPEGDIPTVYYNFQDIYGYVGNTPMHNLITAVQEQRIRDVFSLFTQYMGVQFVETADQGVTIATGDVRVFGPNTPPTARQGWRLAAPTWPGGHQRLLQLGRLPVRRRVHEHGDA